MNYLNRYIGTTVFSILAIFSGFILRFGSLPTLNDEFNLSGLAKLSVFTIAIIFSSFLTEFYTHEKNTKREAFLNIVIWLVVSTFILSIGLYFMMPVVEFGRGWLILSIISFGVFQFLWFIGSDALFNITGFTQRVLIIGTGKLAKQIGEVISTTNHNNVVAGYLKCGEEFEPVSVPYQNIVGNIGSLSETIKKEKVDKIVISLSERRGAFPMIDLLNSKMRGIEVIDAPSFYERLTGKLLIENIRPSWFIFSDGFRMTNFIRIFKRLFDLVFSFIFLISVLPVCFIIALFIKIDSSGPVFLKQVRVGEKERNFVLYKFRTMNRDAENETGAVWTQKDDSRATRFGRFLRKTRLDEIPQLYNIFKGDMSLIGPRPERPEFVGKLKEVVPYYSERHFVKPGLTGWAQVKYHYGSSVGDALEKLKYDLYYIKHLSFFLELHIVFETIRVVVFSRGGR